MLANDKLGLHLGDFNDIEWRSILKTVLEVDTVYWTTLRDITEKVSVITLQHVTVLILYRN